MKPAAAAPVIASSSFSHHHHQQQHHRRSAATTTAAHRSAGSGLPPLSFDEGGKWGGGKGKSVVWVPSTAKAGQAKAYGGQAQQQQQHCVAGVRRSIARSIMTKGCGAISRCLA